MQTAFIVFGAIAGGIYFHEFHHLHEGQAGYGAWALYVVGVLMTVGGVAVVASDVLESPEEGQSNPPPSGKPEQPSSTASDQPKSATASPVMPFNATSPPESPPEPVVPPPATDDSTENPPCAMVVQATAAHVSRC